MPELPEVETIARDLNTYLKNKTIDRIEYVNPGKILRTKQSFFTLKLKNQKIKQVFRRAKMAIMELPSGFVVFHLKMTGQLVYSSGKIIVAGGHPIVSTGLSVPNKFTRLVFHFTNGGALYFNDIRKFAWVEFMSAKDFNAYEAGLGHEPFARSLTLAVFKILLARRSGTSIKAALLDQKLVSGLGNIYVDEVLYRAKVLPSRRVKSLQKTEIARIYKAIRAILEKAILFRGTTFSNYTDPDGRKGNFVAHLKVYGRQGKACPVCGTKLMKSRVAGRGTHFCPHCQK